MTQKKPRYHSRRLKHFEIDVPALPGRGHPVYSLTHRCQSERAISILGLKLLKTLLQVLPQI